MWSGETRVSFVVHAPDTAARARDLLQVHPCRRRFDPAYCSIVSTTLKHIRSSNLLPTAYCESVLRPHPISQRAAPRSCNAGNVNSTCFFLTHQQTKGNPVSGFNGAFEFEKVDFGSGEKPFVTTIPIPVRGGGCCKIAFAQARVLF